MFHQCDNKAAGPFLTIQQQEVIEIIESIILKSISY